MYLLAMDQGTTSSRALLFNEHAEIVAQAQREFPQLLPEPGHVEHDPEAIWNSQLATARAALEKSGVAVNEVAAIGITNQRETTVLWDRGSGRPVANAIVWQSRITAPLCRQLQAEGCEAEVRARTGLRLDPYFSATKIRYLLDRDTSLRQSAERGDILFGTIDSYLAWRLSGGRDHVTDVSNASRTLLLNLQTLEWDDELLRIFQIPRAMLPRIVPSSGVCARVDKQWLGRELPIAGLAGDQQAATFGQTCFTPGSVKNTYGTGCFTLMNIGARPRLAEHGLLTTVGWQIPGETTYCLEGSVFIAGAVVQWLRDGLGIIKTSAEVEALASSVPDSGGVMLVPAFVGLGAPDWDPTARGLIIGLTRGTTAAHIARAAVEAIAYQTAELVEAMRQAANLPLEVLKVDGGAAVNNGLMQFQADIAQVDVHRPRVAETTALGVAYLAGLGAGVWNSTAEIQRHWALDRAFQPQIEPTQSQRLRQRWREAVERAKHWESPATTE